MVNAVRNVSITVGTTSTEISQEQVIERNMIYIRNSSTGGQTITISLGQPAVSGQGIILNVGDFFFDSKSEGYAPYQGRINAISTGAGGSVSVVEW